MKVRSSYKGFTDLADSYFTQIFQRIGSLQFTKGDGPIIAFQVKLRTVKKEGGNDTKINFNRLRMSTELFAIADNLVIRNI